MAKTKLTNQLETAIREELSDFFGCPEVTIGWYGHQRVDYMTMDSKEIFRCFEIKISKSDFLSKHGHNFVGNYNYYVMPKELFLKIEGEIPKEIGVYIWNGIYLSLVKRAKRKELEVNKDILKNSLIRSLYREFRKSVNSKNIKKMMNLERNFKREKKEKEENKRTLNSYVRAIREEMGRDKFNEFRDKYDL